MYCDVTSGLCTYTFVCVSGNIFIPFESWPVRNVKYKYYIFVCKKLHLHYTMDKFLYISQVSLHKTAKKKKKQNIPGKL